MNVLQRYGSSLHGHVADDVSRSRRNNRRGEGLCQAGGDGVGKRGMEKPDWISREGRSSRVLKKS